MQIYMQDYIQELIRDYEVHTGELTKHYATPSYTGEPADRNTGQTVKQREYRSFVGRLMFVIRKCIPDCCNTIRELSIHLDNPGSNHWRRLNRLMGYIKGNTRPLKMRPPKNLRPAIYVDSDYASDRSDRKSISGDLSTIGGAVIGWRSKKQSGVTLSSTEAEYVALSTAAAEAKYMMMLLYELTNNYHAPAVLYEDNTGAIFLATNDSIGQRTKHIDTRYRFTNDLVRENWLVVEYIRTTNNYADLNTKAVVEALHVSLADDIYEGNLKPSSREDVKFNERLKTRTEPGIDRVMTGTGPVLDRVLSGTEIRTDELATHETMSPVKAVVHRDLGSVYSMVFGEDDGPKHRSHKGPHLDNQATKRVAFGEVGEVGEFGEAS
jgi:hypothetical protein